jgi:hypothetical protein
VYGVWHDDDRSSGGDADDTGSEAIVDICRVCRSSQSDVAEDTRACEVARCI